MICLRCGHDCICAVAEDRSGTCPVCECYHALAEYPHFEEVESS
jgi:hypothetical protein